MLKEMSSPAFEKARQPVRRKCIYLLRELIDAVPQLGASQTFLPMDRRAQDAAYTLNAMGFTPPIVVEYVQRPVFTEALLLEILAQAVTIKLLTILRP